MKAQLLVEINKALSPHFLDFEDYGVMFFIPRVLPKPGMALSTEENYQALLLRAANLTIKTLTVNLTILEKKRVDKENVAAPAEATKAVTKSGKWWAFIFRFFAHIVIDEGTSSPARKCQASCQHPEASGPLDLCYSASRYLYRCLLLHFP